jgi:glycopeptide antibiotics resistance protein
MASLQSLVADVFFTLAVAPLHPIAFAVLPLPLLFLRWRGKSAGYLLCFALFFLYGWSVLSYTIFSFVPHGPFVTTFEPVPWYEDMNLVPAVVSGTFDVRSYQVYGNVLLGVPFGVGFPFLVRTSRRTALLACLAFAAGIEVAQLLVGLAIFGTPYRVIDIDDVLTVGAGSLAGHAALWIAALLYRWIGWAGGARLPVWAHFHEVLLHVASGGSPPAEGPARTARQGEAESVPAAPAAPEEGGC